MHALLKEELNILGNVQFVFHQYHFKSLTKLSQWRALTHHSFSGQQRAATPVSQLYKNKNFIYPEGNSFVMYMLKVIFNCREHARQAAIWDGAV